jgi:O-antigen ligase
MAIISKESTFTLEKMKSITYLNIAKFFLLLTVMLPFFIYKRASPQFAFFSELTGVICASLFILFACLDRQKFVLFNRLTLYLGIIASYLFLDIHINSPIYPSIHWLYIGALILGASLASMISNLSAQRGYPNIFNTLCYCLMAGAVLQDLVVILQMLHQEWLNGWIFFIDSGQAYSGNIGQRNLLAHYLSWGILATAYLVYNKSLGNISGWALVIFQAAILGAVNSKTLVIYMLAILMLLIIASIWQRHLLRSVYKPLIVTVILVLIFQVMTLPLLNIFQDSSSIGASSVSRLTNNPELASRLNEWYKAWLIFLGNPWFGTGWSSYGYQGFMASSDFYFTNILTGRSLFSHTHSIIFNLLAETGMVGTAIILGGFSYLLKPLFTKKWTPETVFLSAMVIVTAVHSLVEFPLWHTHFFLVFVILLTILICSVEADPTQQPYNSNIKFLSKAVVFSFSFISFVVSVQMYYLYSKMEQYTYSYEKNEQDRINTASHILSIGDKQPLIRTYTDIRATLYLAGISPDKIPNIFNQPLYNFAHYLPEKISGIYYLAKQCDGNREWSADNWKYYDQLSYYYKDTLPTYSIILSMTQSCDKVYDIVYEACVSYYKTQGINPICSIETSKYRLK